MRRNDWMMSLSKLFCVTVIIFLQLLGHHSSVITNNDSLLASQHFTRILKEAKCQTPVPKVIHISDFILSAKRKFVPHCTLLHFCGHFSGCCRQENEECVAKTVEEVKLHFWVIELLPDGKQKKGVDFLTMKNHTECHCQPINDNTPR